MIKCGVFVGRMNPIHSGHVEVCRYMRQQCGNDGSLAVIGSANAPFSLRHFFSYVERRDFFKTIFPDMPVVGLPDYHNDQEWLLALDDLLEARGFDLADVTFFGGCREDLSFFFDAGRTCHIINRFDGTTPRISATEVRDCLIYDRPLEGMLHNAIEEKVRTIFKEKWEMFKKI